MKIDHPRQAREIAACFDGRLYALNADKSLWINKDRVWEGHVGRWQKVADLPSDARRIVCAAGQIWYQRVESGELWYIPKDGAAPIKAGKPHAAIELAGEEDNSLSFPVLWALNYDKTLWRNGGGGEDANWKKVGQPHAARRIAAADGVLFALNNDGSLWMNKTGGQDRKWENIGNAGLAIELT